MEYTSYWRHPSLPGYGALRRTGLQEAGTGLASGAGAQLASIHGVSSRRERGAACPVFQAVI